ncbi:rhodanese family protein [Terricaulis sp.]|uniref:rhodanese family protein n=1 Tax=Terricaulis sp. TaxID=2768686 RepID=UPI002AC7C250|nr:rhodanese family protein [Terricaulis sp.]MDZ4692159.1 rhodanese family protein [Terricaulis sp.]
MTELNPINAAELKRRLDSGEAVLIDIRESDEHAREHILGARLAPLSAIDTHDFDRDHGKVAVFHCKSGMRTQANAARLLARGFRQAYFLDGGIEAWKAAGFGVHTNVKAPLEIMRQVQITAGLLILTGVVLGWFVNPVFYALSALVGAGLTFAGATGWCGMALMLKAMPWNRASVRA